MVNVVAGAGLGLFNTRQTGVGGSGMLGQGNEGIAVNTATGNLVLDHRDQVLVGRGDDSDLVSTYNSLGQVDGDNNDGFRFNFSEQVNGLTGTVNTAGSTITRVNGDGNISVFTFDTDSSVNCYVSGAGSGAFDTLSYNSGSNVWTYKEGSSQLTETYGAAYASGQWRLNTQLDANGLGITSITYIANSDRIQTVMDSSGQTITLAYSGSNVSSVSTGGTGTAYTMVTYGYDAYNRLVSITQDLSPADHSIADGNVYTTTYTYMNTTTNLVASVTQSDGTVATFGYELIGGVYTNSSRVTSVTVGSGAAAQVTNYVYGTNTTNVNQQLSSGVFATTTVNYDSQQRLTSVVTPPDVNGQRLTTRYTYDTGNSNVALQNDLLSITDARGAVTKYSYDTRGNRLVERLPSGETTRWVYSSNNLLLREIKYIALDTTGSADPAVNNTIVNSAQGNGLVTRYVYDSSNRLRFVVDANGEVTESRYTDGGLTISQITYMANLYSSSSSAESDLMSWVTSSVTDLTTMALKVTTLDFRGQVMQVTTFGATNTDGTGDSSTASKTYYAYDQFGNLLKSVDARGASITDTTYDTVYTYDGMGRATSVTDTGGNVTTTTYNDAAHKVVTSASGGSGTNAGTLYTTSVYSTAGQVTSVQQSATSGDTALSAVTNQYDSLGLLRATIDPVYGTTYFLYDELSRRVGMVDGTGALTEYVYDADNHVSKTITYANLVNADAMGMLASEVAANDYSGTAGSDPLRAGGSIRPAMDPTNDRITQDIYNASGELQYTIDASGSVTGMAYDGAGQLITKTQYATAPSSILSSLYGSNYSLGLQLNSSPVTFSMSNASVVPSDNYSTEFTLADGVNYGVALADVPVASSAVVSTTYTITDRNHTDPSDPQYYSYTGSCSRSQQYPSLVLGDCSASDPCVDTGLNLAPGVSYSVSYQDKNSSNGVVGAGAVQFTATSYQATTITWPLSSVPAGAQSYAVNYVLHVPTVGDFSGSIGNDLSTSDDPSISIGIYAPFDYSITYYDGAGGTGNIVGVVSGAAVTPFAQDTTATGIQLATTGGSSSTVLTGYTLPDATSNIGTIDAKVYNAATGVLVSDTVTNPADYESVKGAGLFSSGGNPINLSSTILPTGQYRVMITVKDANGQMLSEDMIMISQTAKGEDINATVGGGYSYTPMTIGNTIKTFDTQAGLAYNPGSRIRLTMVADGVNSYMEGEVLAYDGTSMTVSVDTSVGSGSAAIWNLSSADNRVTHYDYDNAGHMTGMLDPDNYYTQYRYNKAGQLVETHQYGAIRTQDVISSNTNISVTSSSAITPAKGTKTFTIPAGMSIPDKALVRLSSSNGASYMAGQVTGQSGDQITVHVTTAVGTVSDTDWVLSLDGGSSIGPLTVDDSLINTTQLFSVSPDLGYTAGMLIRLSVDDGSTYLEGIINSDYNAGDTSMRVTISAVAGSGTYNNWQISAEDTIVSEDTHTVGTGSQSFVVEAGLGYVANQSRVRMSADGGASMEGIVTAYDNTTGALTLDVDTTSGSGNYTDWMLNVELVGSSSNTATSVSLIQATTGSQSFTVPLGLSYTSSMRVRLSANDGATYMEGKVYSYNVNTGLMIVTVDTAVTASGDTNSYGDWQITADAMPVAVSSSAVAAATGSQTFTVQTGLPYIVNSSVVRLSANGGTTYMEGMVTAYSGDQLTVNVTTATGTGSYQSWSLGYSHATSVTSTTPSGTTDTPMSQTFTVAAGLANISTSGSTQTFVRLSSRDGTSYMEGLVTAYNSTTGSMTVGVINSGGTASADWQLSIMQLSNVVATLSSGTFTVNATTQAIANAPTGYAAGTRVRFTDSGGTNYIEGRVTSYSGTTMSVAVDKTGGTAGTNVTGWNFYTYGSPTVADSLTLGTTTTQQTLSTQAGLHYAANQRVRLSVNNGATYMEGVVYSYSGTTLTLNNFDTAVGTAGSYSNWQLSSTYVLPSAAVLSVNVSTLSVSLSTPVSMTFNIKGTGTFYAVGSRVHFVRNSGASYIEGIVTAATSTLLTVNIDTKSGNSAAASDWSLSSAVVPTVAANLSLAITTEPVSFTTQPSLPYDEGQRIRLSINSSTYMEGVISSYDSTTGVMVLESIDTVAGAAGTYSNWQLSATTAGTATTLTLPLTLPVNNQVFTVPSSGQTYTAGQRVRFENGDDSSVYVEGKVVSSTSTSVTVDIDTQVYGATSPGAISSWTLRQISWQAANIATNVNSIPPTTGIQVFTVPSGLSYNTSTRVRLSANNGVAYMEGYVSSYDGTSMTVYVDTAVGSGVYGAWQLSAVASTNTLYSTAIFGAAPTFPPTTENPLPQFTAPKGLSFIIGSSVVRLVSTSVPGTFIKGIVTGYDTSTGAMTISVGSTSGVDYSSTGTSLTTWRISADHVTSVAPITDIAVSHNITVIVATGLTGIAQSQPKTYVRLSSGSYYIEGVATAYVSSTGAMTIDVSKFSIPDPNATPPDVINDWQLSFPELSQPSVVILTGSTNLYIPASAPSSATITLPSSSTLFSNGERVRFTNTSSSKYIEGIVENFHSGDSVLTIAVDKKFGSNITLSGWSCTSVSYSDPTISQLTTPDPTTGAYGITVPTTEFNYTVGQRVRLTYSATQYMEGVVLSYDISNGAMNIKFDTYVGGCSPTDQNSWTLSGTTAAHAYAITPKNIVVDTTPAPTQTFTVPDSGLSYLGTCVRLIATGTSGSYLEGIVTGATTTSITVSILSTHGVAANVTDWQLSPFTSQVALITSGLTIATTTTPPPSFTVQSGLPYATGQRVRLSIDASHYMEGVVSTYSGNLLTLSSIDTAVGGDGFTTYSSWQLSATTVWQPTEAPIDLSSLTGMPSTTHTQTFTIPFGGLDYSVGTRLRYVSSTDGSTYVEGLVTGSTTSTVTLAIDTRSAATGTISGGTLVRVITIATGSATFTVPTYLNYAVGDPVVLVARGTNNFMKGTITAYASGSSKMTVDITSIFGSGTYTDWQLSEAVTPATGTSLTYDYSTKYVTTQAGLPYSVGSYVRLTTGDGAIYMEGMVQSYNVTTGNMTINNIGSLVGGVLGNTYSDWQLFSDGAATVSTGTNVSAIAAVTGLQVFTMPLGSGAGYNVGDRVRFIANGNTSLYMEGVLTNQTSTDTSTSMTVNVDTAGGTGTSSGWQLSVVSATTVVPIDVSTLTSFPITKTFTIPSSVSAWYPVNTNVQFVTSDAAITLQGTVVSYDGESMTVSITSLTNASTSDVVSYSAWQLGLPPTTPLLDIHSYNIYDNRGNLVASIDGEGYLTETTYNVTGTVDNVTQYAHKLNTTSLLKTVNGNSTKLTLAMVNAALTTNSEDRTTSYTYNNLNQRLTETNPLGAVTTYSYSAAGQLTGTSTVGGSTTRQTGNVYDLQGRLIEEDTGRYFDSSDATGYNTDKITHTYDAAGRVLSTTDAAGNKTLFYYDVDNRLAYSINALGEVTGMAYNNFGQLTQTTQFANRMSSSAMSGLVGGSASTIISQVSAITAPEDDIVTQTTYDQRGNVASQSDANTMAARAQIGLLSEQYSYRSQEYPGEVYQYNAFGEVSALVKVIKDINGLSDQTSTTYFSYDRRGLLTKEILSGSNDWTDPNNNVTTMQYDAFGQVVETTDPEGNAVLLGYDRRGLVTTRTSGENNVTTTTYDAFKRVLSVKEPGNADATTYSYNQATRSYTVTTPEGIQTKTILDQFGEVLQVKLLSNSPIITLKTYNYDANGNVISVTDGNGNTSSTTYDARDVVATTTDRNGIVTTFTFDAARRMTQRVVDSVEGGANQTTQWIYDAAGRQTTQTYVEQPSIIFGDGTRVTQMSYDHNGNLVRIVRDPAGLNLVTTYTYNRENNVVTMNEGYNNGTTDIFERTTQKNYNALGQLASSVVDPSGLNLTTSYSYNQDGMVTLVTSPSGVQTYSFYNRDNQVRFVATSIGDGSQLAVTENQYDSQGRLTSVIQYSNAISTALVENVIEGDNTAISQTTELSGLVTLDTINDRQSYILYNEDSQVTYSIDSSGLITHNLYNAQGLVITRTQYATTLPSLVTSNLISLPNITNSTLVSALGSGTASDRTTQTQYDKDGNVSTSIDAQNYHTDYVRDGEGNVLQETQANGSSGDHVTIYRYDSLGHLAYTLTQTGSDQYQVTQTSIDEFGETTGVRQLANTLNYSICNDIHSTSSTNPYTTTADLDSQVTTNDTNDKWVIYGYDRAGRLNLKANVNLQAGNGTIGSLTTSYTYNSLGQQTRTSYDNPMTSLNLPAPSDSDRLTNSFYDGAGRLVYILTMVGSVQSDPSSVKAYVTQNVYNADGKVIRTIKYATALSGPSGATKGALDYTSTEEVTADVAEIASATDEINDTVYDAGGRVVYQIDGEGYVTGFTYNMFGQVLSQTSYPNQLDRDSVFAGSLPTVATISPLVGLYEDFSDGHFNTFSGYQLAQYPNAANISNGALHLVNAKVNSATTPVNAGYTANLGSAAQSVTVAADITVQEDTSDHELVAQFYLENDGSGVAYRAHGIKIANGHVQFISNAGSGWVVTNATAAPVTLGTTLQIVLSKDSSGSHILVIDIASMTVIASEDLSSASDAMGSWNVNQTRSLKVKFLSEVSSAKSQTSLATGASYADVNNVIILHSSSNTTTNTPVTQYIYDNGGRVLQETTGALTPSINTTDFMYDAFGDAVQLTDANGHATTQAFDHNGRKLSATDAMGEATSTQYDAFGNIIQATDARGNSGYFFYDANNQATYQVDANGYVTQYVRDNLGEVTQTNRYSNAISTTSLTLDNLKSQLSANPKTSTGAAYNQLGQKVTVTDALSHAESTTYDSFGNVESVTDQAGYVTTYQYDQLNRKISQTQDIDLGGTPTDSVPRKQVTTQYQYDVFGNQTQLLEDYNSTTNTASRTTSYIYNRNNQLTQTNLPSVTTLQTTATTDVASFNSTSRIISNLSTQGTGVEISTWPTSNTGNVSKVYQTLSNGAGYFGVINDQPGSFGFTAYVVDSQGNYLQQFSGTYSVNSSSVVTVTQLGNLTSYSSTQVASNTKKWYDESGNVIKDKDANGNLTYYYYNALNQKVAMVDAEGYLHEYSYDAVGNLLAEFAYNARVDIAHINLDLQQPTTDNLIVNNTDDPSQNYNASLTRETDYTYDAANHVISKSTAPVYVYQPTPMTFTISGTGTSRLVSGQVSAQLPPGVVSVTAILGSWSASMTPVTGNSSLLQFSRTNTTSGTYALQLDYLDSTGAVIYQTESEPLIVPADNGATTACTVIFSAGYQYNNGYQSLVTTQEYDAMGNVTKIIQPGGAQLYAFYDANGNLVLQVDANGYAVSHDYDANNKELHKTEYATQLSATSLSNLANSTAANRASLLTGLMAELTGTPSATSSSITIGSSIGTSKTLTIASGLGYAVGSRVRFTHAGGSNYIEGTITAYTGTSITIAVDTAAGSGSFTSWNLSSTQNRVTDYVYDGVGNLRFQTEENVQTTSFSSGGTRSTTYQDLTTETQYDNVGNVTATIDANGAETDYSYDGLHRKILEQDPIFTDGNGNSVRTSMQWTYDNLGNIRTESKLGTNGDITTDDEITTYQYDAAGNVIQKTDAMGVSTNYYYDLNGNVVASLQQQDASSGVANGTVSTGSELLLYTYNKLNRLASQSDGLGFNKLNTYDAFGEIVAEGSEDPSGNVVMPTYFVYDNAGRLIVTNQKDGVEHGYLYDARGNMTADIMQTGTAGGETLRDKLSDNPFALAGLQNHTSYVDGDGNTHYVASSVSRTEYAYDLNNHQIATYQPPQLTTTSTGTSNQWVDALGQISQNVGNITTMTNNNVTATIRLSSVQSYHVTTYNVTYTVTVPDTSALGLGSVTVYRIGGASPVVAGIVSSSGGTVTWTYSTNSNIYNRYGRNLPGSWLNIGSNYGSNAAYLVKTLWNGTPVKIATFADAATATDANDWTSSSANVFNYHVTIPSTLYFSALPATAAGIKMKLWSSGDEPTSYNTTAVTPVTNVNGNPIPAMFQMNMDGDDKGGGTYNYDYVMVDANGDQVGGEVKGTLTIQITPDGVKHITIQSQLVYESVNSSSVSQNIESSFIQYDAFGNAIAQTDGNGNTTHLVYDNRGLLIQKIDPQTDITQHDDDTVVNGAIVHNVSTTTVRGTPTTDYYYDAAGRSIGMQDADSEDRYNTAHNGYVTTNANEYETRNVYDAAGHLLQTIDAMGIAKQKAYDVFGNQVKETDPLDDSTVSVQLYTYDKLNQLTRTQLPVDGTFRMSNAAVVLGNSMEMSQDLIGTNNIFTTSSSGEFTSRINETVRLSCDYKYVDGLIIAFTATSFTLKITDVSGNGHVEGGSFWSVSLQNLPDGETIGQRNEYTAYNYQGQRIAQRDALGNWVHYQYDDAGRLISSTDAMGATTTYSYSSNSTAATSASITLGSVNQTSQTFNVANGNSYILNQRVTFTKKNGSAYVSGVVTGQTATTLTVSIDTVSGSGTVSNWIISDDVGVAGGYTKVTTNPDNRTLVDVTSYFNRLLKHTDLSGRNFTYTYNAAGWLTHQQSDKGALITIDGNNNPVTPYYSSSVQDIDYTYYSNGLVKTVTDNTLHTLAYYEYDQNGNRTTERYANIDSSGNVTSYYQDATATYDALNRVSGVTDASNYNITYSYDANGNRMHIYSDYTQNGGKIQDYWYTYDNDNRFTVTEGVNIDGVVDIGYATGDGTPQGFRIGYDEAGNRISEAYHNIANGQVWQEDYHYNIAGLLTDSYVLDADAHNLYKASRSSYDADGDVLTYYEGKDTSNAVWSSHTTESYTQTLLDGNTYKNNGQMWSQYENNNGNASTIVYSYNPGGELSQILTIAGPQLDPTYVTTTYSYDYWDSAKQGTIRVKGSAEGISDWKPGYSNFTYDANGHLSQVIDDKYNSGNGRSITYINDRNGEVLKRTETANIYAGTSSSVYQNYFYFNDVGIGDVGNDGNGNLTASATDYGAALAASQGNQGQKYKIKEADSADFDQGFMPINSTYPASTPGTYTVSAGDTLATIAQTIWGDASLWYVLADANALTTAAPTSDISASPFSLLGGSLVIPNVVGNIHNNSSTFKPYDPNAHIGNTSPTLPDAPPPDTGGGCGGAAMIVMIVVIVVACIVAPELMEMVTNLGGALVTTETATACIAPTLSLAGAAVVGAATAAIADVAGQLTGMALGVQDGFSWNQVGHAAIAGAITGGVTNGMGGGPFDTSGVSPGDINWATVGNAVAANFVSQGIDIALNQQHTVNWAEIAGAGVATYASGEVSDSLKNIPALDTAEKQFASTFAGQLASNATQVAINGEGKINWASVAANAAAAAINSFGQQDNTGTQKPDPMAGEKQQTSDAVGGVPTTDEGFLNSSTNAQQVWTGNATDATPDATSPTTLGTHTIQSGDTLNNLAKQDLGPGATQAQILQRTQQYMQANPDQDPLNLPIGQTINVPGSDLPVSAATNQAYAQSDQKFAQYSLDNFNKDSLFGYTPDVDQARANFENFVTRAGGDASSISYSQNSSSGTTGIFSGSVSYGGNMLYGTSSGAPAISDEATQFSLAIGGLSRALNDSPMTETAPQLFADSSESDTTHVIGETGAIVGTVGESSSYLATGAGKISAISLLRNSSQSYIDEINQVVNSSSKDLEGTLKIAEATGTEAATAVKIYAPYVKAAERLGAVGSVVEFGADMYADPTYKTIVAGEANIAGAAVSAELGAVTGGEIGLGVSAFFPPAAPVIVPVSAGLFGIGGAISYESSGGSAWVKANFKQWTGTAVDWIQNQIPK